MIELIPSQFSQASALFSSTSFGVLAAGTLEGGHPGRIFVDVLPNPKAALLCTRVGYYFLAGQADHPEVNAWLPRIITSDLAPAQMAMLNDPQVLLFYPTPSWRASLLENFSKWEQPLALQKKRMVLPPGLPKYELNSDTLTTSGLRLRAYDQDLLNQDRDLAGEVELFYSSAAAFLQHSLGFCLQDEHGHVASACHAVFTGGGEAEISIFTAPQYRRRGLAAITASAFITACQARGLAPIWGCFPDNTPSVCLARKLGFVNDVDQDFYLFQHLNGGSPSEMPSTNIATA